MLITKVEYPDASVHQQRLAITCDATGEVPQQQLYQPEIAHLFHTYIKKLAPWYDLNDERLTFSNTVAAGALHNPLLFSAAIAFAAIYSHKRSSFPRHFADSYHRKCIRLLIDLKEDDDEVISGNALASTCLLRQYELLSEDRDPNRHLYGASALVPPVPSLINHDLIAASFWNYLREDITYSLIQECPLKLQLPRNRFTSVNLLDDEAANLMTLLLGRTINAFFGRINDDTGVEIADWHARYSKEPFCNIDGGAFPVIKMMKDCHVAALHYYHVAQCMITPIQRTSSATTLCGLAVHAQSDAVTVNAYGPICFTAQWLTFSQQRDTIINFLLESQQQTAWPVKPIIDKLQARWHGFDTFEQDQNSSY
ncbi:hypothetical protein H2198_004607 [Neophaeococcomyces mojaviensis]|uniref:Uncharacterized protein n=1 Tax=Neophaeococcomyces mojaviensis TaxID=3383035 RepID=A0ACC3A8C8_9EURO|nr:hypothetical protein H2198_004607 [Knufia sp. JES_112]